MLRCEVISLKNNFVLQALLVFSRDTSVLKHFEQSSATPPKSFIRGKQKCGSVQIVGSASSARTPAIPNPR